MPVFEISTMVLNVAHLKSYNQNAVPINVKAGGGIIGFLKKLLPFCFSLGRIRTRRQSSGSATSITSTAADTRGRSRAKVVSQSQRKELLNCICHLSS